nr:hypothetical protein CFP56_33482 [Quercus suber]
MLVGKSLIATQPFGRDHLGNSVSHIIGNIGYLTRKMNARDTEPLCVTRTSSQMCSTADGFSYMLHLHNLAHEDFPSGPRESGCVSNPSAMGNCTPAWYTNGFDTQSRYLFLKRHAQSTTCTMVQTYMFLFCDARPQYLGDFGDKAAVNRTEAGRVRAV